MCNYRIWKSDKERTVIIEFWNKNDVAIIQKELIEKGYYILRTSFNVFDNHHLMKVEKIEDE